MNPHEQGFLAFLAEPTRRRVATLLERGDKRRADVRALLDHAIRLEPRFARRLDGADTFSQAIERLLREQGAPATCHVLSAGRALDGREMPLTEALAAIVGRENGAFVSCLPGRLGVYIYESPGPSYLLSR